MTVKLTTKTPTSDYWVGSTYGVDILDKGVIRESCTTKLYGTIFHDIAHNGAKFKIYEFLISKTIGSKTIEKKWKTTG